MPWNMAPVRHRRRVCVSPMRSAMNGAICAGTRPTVTSGVPICAVSERNGMRYSFQVPKPVTVPPSRT